MSKASTGTKYLKLKDYASFGAAMFANGALTGMMQGYLLTYCLTIIESEYSYWLTIIFVVAKIWDGINDPIMGAMIDRTKKNKWGKMRPYILFGSVPLGLMTILMFCNPFTAQAARLVVVFVGYILWDVCSTLVDVPLQGLYTVITPDNDERTNVITVTRIIGSLGEQASLVLTSILFLDVFGISKRWGLSGAAIIIGVLAPIILIIGVLNTKERINSVPEERPKLLDSFRYLIKCKPLLILIFSNLLTFFRNFVSALIIYVVTCIFYKPSSQIFFSLPGAIAAVLGMLFAPFLKKRFDSKTIFFIATIAHSVLLAVVYLAGSTFIKSGNMSVAMIAIALLMFFAMLPVGLLNTVPSLMATDTIDYMDWKHGVRAEGMTFSLMTLRSKISSGLKDGFMILFLVYIFKFVGYGAEDNLFPDQSEFTKNGIFMMYTLIPAALNLISLIPMKFYPLNGKLVRQINEELAVRRSGAPIAAGGGESENFNIYA